MERTSAFRLAKCSSGAGNSGFWATVPSRIMVPGCPVVGGLHAGDRAGRVGLPNQFTGEPARGRADRRVRRRQDRVPRPRGAAGS